MIYTSLNPEKALIWRIVHRDNLPWLLENGLHCANSNTRFLNRDISALQRAEAIKQPPTCQNQ